MNRIFIQTVTCGIFVRRVVSHRIQRADLLQRDNLVLEVCYLSACSADSAELPSISAVIAEDKRGHWLISAASLNLCVGAALPLALAAGE